MVEKAVRGLGLAYVCLGGWLLLSIIPLVAMETMQNFWFYCFNGVWTFLLGTILLEAKIICQS